MHFGRLPVEILEKIHLELHYFDICNMKLVSGGIDTSVLAGAENHN